MVGALCVVLRGNAKAATASGAAVAISAPAVVVQMGQFMRSKDSPSHASPPSPALTVSAPTIADDCNPSPELVAASPHSTKGALVLQLQ
jgi:hypothetical protein